MAEQQPPKDDGVTNFMSDIQTASDALYYAYHVFNPSRPSFSDYQGPQPDKFLQMGKAFIKNLKGESAEEFFADARAEIDTMEAPDVLNFITKDLGREGFRSLYNNNKGIRDIILNGAKEKVYNVSLRESLTRAKIDVNQINFDENTDTSILDKNLGDTDPIQVENFIKGLNDKETREFLHRLPVDAANQLITELGQKEVTSTGRGKARTKTFVKIEGYNINPLPEDASPEDITKAVDAAINWRTSHESTSLLGIKFFNASGTIMQKIRLSMANNIKERMIKAKEDANAITADSIYDELEKDEDEALILLNDKMPLIRKELKKKENITFIIDASDSLTGEALFNFIRKKMDQYPMFAKFAPIIFKILSEIDNLFNLDLANPPKVMEDSTPNPLEVDQTIQQTQKR